MGLEKYLNKSTKSFLKKSQNKIVELKNKLENLNEREYKLEKHEKEIIKESNKPQKETVFILSIDSVIKSTFTILLVLGSVYLLAILKSVIILFLVALFLSAAFNPAVDKLHEYKIPRSVGIILMYVLVIGVFIVMMTFIIPVVAEQITSIAFSIRDMIFNILNSKEPQSKFAKLIYPFANQIWESVDQTELITSLTQNLQLLASNLTNVAGNAIGAVFAIFNGILNTLVVLIITFFMVLNSKDTSNFFHSLFPIKYSNYISVKTKQVTVRIGGWIRGQILLAIIMGIISYIVFSLIGLNFALTLAMISAIAEFIPFLGPFATFISASVIAINQDPIIMLILLPTYAILQFTEGNILLPLIMGKSVGMNPIVVLFALLSGATIGLKLGGSLGLSLLGMIISVPIANIISIFVEEYTEKNK